jgi:diphthamide biosynthesis protein 7
MGVTCISVNQNNPEYFLTGSYDENLRLWDIRNLKDCVNSINFDGGVWRAVWKPYTNVLLNIKSRIK